MAKRAKKTEGKGPPRVNRFHARAKMDEVTFIRVVYFFCNGLPVAMAARLTGLSAKTVRGIYIDLRGRLLKPEFNRWHGSHQRLLALAGSDEEFAVRTLYLNMLARCAGNETCARNYRLGNRKKRQCRACPLAEVNSDERRADAYAVIDAVHDFYENLGIRGEKNVPPTILFRERLVHAATISTIHANSPKLKSEFLNPNRSEFLSGRSLMNAILIEIGVLKQ